MANKRKLIIETTNVNKGGGGKTTFTYNRASYLAKKGYKVCVIDGDHSCNLTRSFNINEDIEETIFELFIGKVPGLYPTDKENIDIIPGSPFLTDEATKITKNNNYYMVFSGWISDNYDYLSENYDYLLIDTHNDTSFITANFLAASNINFCLVNPDSNGFEAWLDINEFTNNIKNETRDKFSKRDLVDVQNYLIGNRIDKSKIAKAFISEVQNEENYIGYIPEKALLKETLTSRESIFEKQEIMTPSTYAGHKNFFDHVLNLYNEIEKIEDKLTGQKYIF